MKTQTTKVTVSSDSDSAASVDSSTTSIEATQNKQPAKKRGGAPSKKALAAKKPGGRGKVGRPKGDAAIMNEYKARMLASPKSREVLAKVFEVALDDDHKNQAACMKMVVDRIAPVSSFEKEVSSGGGRNAIEIKITGISGSVGSSETIEDVDFTEVD